MLKKNEKYTRVLEQAYQEAGRLAESKQSKEYDRIITDNVDILIKSIDKDKSLFGALVTSLLKKSLDSEQDIRLHRTDFEGGYSARSLDTKVTTPFFKQHFPKYANKESAFLTLATRERIKWTVEEGDNIKTRNKQVKKSFLILLGAAQGGRIKSTECLIYIMEKLKRLSEYQQQIYDTTITVADFSDIVNIDTVIKMLEEHFTEKLSSRLPVIAIYSIYQELFKTIKFYEEKKLRPLNVHTSADKHGYGDIEIWDKDETPFEMVEIKHNKPIERDMIFDIVKKTENTTVGRYYILTTSKDNFLSHDEEEYIKKFILKIKKERGLEIIANGIISSLKYYLRFIPDYKKFIIRYTSNLITDSENSTEVKEFHIKKWQEILSNHKVSIFFNC